MVDVPAVAGVPALDSYATAEDVVLLAADAVNILRLLGPPQWGIFDADGNAVLVGDTVKAFEYAKEYRISDFPVEGGGFASYNKVAIPYQTRVTFVQAGTGDDRAIFLQTADRALASLTLFAVATPEVVYLNANLVREGYRRVRESGANQITVEIWVQEVRQAQSLEFTRTQAAAQQAQAAAASSSPQTAPWGQVRSATAADQVNDGTIAASEAGDVVGRSIPTLGSTADQNGVVIPIQ